jgi:hypothetical protein
MSAGTSFHGRRKPNGSACHRRTMAGSRTRRSTRERDVAVEVLRRREAPAPAGRCRMWRWCWSPARCSRHARSRPRTARGDWSPCPDDGRPGRVVHDRDGRRNGDGAAAIGLMTKVRRGAGRKEQNVVAVARAARAVQVLGRCATGLAFDQQSDRVGLVLLPAGEARIAAGKGLDLGPVVRGNADTWPVARSHGRGAGVQLPRPCRPARLREADITLRRARAGVLPHGQDEPHRISSPGT